jgi:hypothetical protein
MLTHPPFPYSMLPFFTPSCQALHRMLTLSESNVLYAGSVKARRGKTPADSRKAHLEYLREIASRGGKIGGKARMESMSGLERSLFASKGGKVGALARAASLTPKRRREIAKKAARARWTRR